ncbi:NAD(P)-binding domain-containing protein [Priestia abyssalis]|uniref:NAD(P)-binding domain-containing protein n=1 Tax=Priestia abyssalis TaxID=1221450 RepID=UPI001472729B|nr:NAD(P)-binding domain-containing protein [Priestia abyssalis]
MEKQNWVVAGIGKLGRALLSRFEIQGIQVGIFHPDINKANDCLQEYPFHRIVKKEDLGSADFLILALPANQIIPFVKKLESHHLSLQKPILINMATAAHTSKLKGEYPHLKWFGMKFVGQADDLRKNGEGLFVTEESSVDSDSQLVSVSRMFSEIGRVIIDSEATVEKVNRIATYHAIKAAKEIEQELRSGGYQNEYEQRVLLSLVPEVVRSYAHGTLGHFGQSIAAEFDQEDEKQKDIRNA